VAEGSVKAEAGLRDKGGVMTERNRDIQQDEVLKRWQEEVGIQVKRMANAVELSLRSAEPDLGQTPRDLVYRKGKARLYRYRGMGDRRHPVPLLMVPNLGISRPYIFDLRSGNSFIEFMVKQGFDFYLLDWGVFGDEDNGLTVDRCVVEILPVMVRKLLQASQARALSLLGYCMGAPLSACYVALHPDVPVRNLVNMAGPIDFSKAGLFTVWMDKRHFDVAKLVDTFGGMPANVIRMGFKLLKPTADVTTYSNLWWNLGDDRYVQSFKALHRWSNEYVPIPGTFFKQWVEEFYQGNKLIKGELALGGRRVDLSDIQCSVLVVAAQTDYIAPAECVGALIDIVASEDKDYLELPGGHISLIAGRQASKVAWPKVSEWLDRRSQ
jgi:polyhydroxyalkanoate synthase subunit PhaC